MAKAPVKAPPSEPPRSCSEPWSQRKAWLAWSPTRLEPPTIWPRSLRSVATVQVPPKLPRSLMPLPFSQMKDPVSRENGQVLGGVEVEPVYDQPTTCPASLIRMACASVPPGSVSKSCIPLFFSHRNARVSKGNGGPSQKLPIELGSGTVLMAAPTTWPRLL